MDDMDDSLLDGLNTLVNAADKPQQKSTSGKRNDQPAKQVDQTGKPDLVKPVFDDASAKQIIERLDGIKQSIDVLARVADGHVEQKPAPEPVKLKLEQPKPDTTKPAKAERQAPQPKPKAESGASEDRVFTMPYVALVTAAMVLVAFALGMGYGAIVAAGKFPFWYQPGLPGALADWIAAPAGILLLPVVAGLLALGGLELRKEGQAAATPVFVVAGILAVISILLPFMV